MTTAQPEEKRATDDRLQSVRDYLAAPRCAVLTTLDPDGGPHPAVVHYLHGEDALVVNGRADRKWVTNLRQRRQVSIVVHDTDEPLHWVGIKGSAEVIHDNEAAVEDAMTLARRYGEDPEQLRGQQRVSFRILPRRVFEYRP